VRERGIASAQEVTAYLQINGRSPVAFGDPDNKLSGPLKTADPVWSLDEVVALLD
jgi:hypothetical protein